MSNDPIRGKTLVFAFTDGLMAEKAFEHTFDEQGFVTFHALGHGQAPDRPAQPETQARKATGTKYVAAEIRNDLWTVSYLSSSGYTLTSVLDFKTGKLVAFSSNEKILTVQHGTFEKLGASRFTNHARTRAHG